MAITPSQWSHVLTIPESYTPSAATSGQTLVITESVISKLSAGDQATFWANVQNGGGDVRICESSDGTSQLPVEVVSLDNAAQTCVIWTRKPSYDGAGNLYLFVGKAGETQPAVTDPFGRNAVWQDDYRRQGGDGQQDATGASTITLQGLSSATSQKIKGFNALFFPFQDGSAEATSRAQFNGTSGADFTGDFTVSAWVKPESLTISFAQIIGIRGVSDWEFSLRLEGSQPAILIGSSSPNSTGNLIAGVEQLLHATVSGSTISFYLNGSPIGTASISGARVNRSQLLTFGGIDAAAATGTTFHGRIAEARAINGTALPSSHIATEYANQNDPAAFYGTPTLSATTTPTVGADVNYTISAPTFTASANASLPQPSADASFTISAPSFSANGSATLPQPIGDVSFTVNAPSFTANAAASLPQPLGDVAFTVNAPTFNANASATIPGFSASVDFDISAPIFSASGSVTLPQPTADIGYSIAAPTFNASATASLPQPSADVGYTVQVPLFSVDASATLTGYVADVNYTVLAPTFTASAEATLPQPIADLSFTIPSPQFSVVAIVGGIAIIVDDETNINLPALSNNVTLPALSNNIDL